MYSSYLITALKAHIYTHHTHQISITQTSSTQPALLAFIILTVQYLADNQPSWTNPRVKDERLAIHNVLSLQEPVTC